jgi:hypothetical protein
MRALIGVEIPMNLQYNEGPRMLKILVPDDNINGWDSPYKSVASAGTQLL